MLRNSFIWITVVVLALVGLLLVGGFTAFMIGSTQGLTWLNNQPGVPAGTFLASGLEGALSLLVMVIVLILLVKLIGRIIFSLLWLFSGGPKMMASRKHHFYGHQMRRHYCHPHARGWWMFYDEDSEEAQEPSTEKKSD